MRSTNTHKKGVKMYKLLPHTKSTITRDIADGKTMYNAVSDMRTATANAACSLAFRGNVQITEYRTLRDTWLWLDWAAFWLIKR